MWHYLCFIVLVKVKDSTEYTGPESYVAEMIKVSGKVPTGGAALKTTGLPSQPRVWFWPPWGSCIPAHQHLMLTEAFS